MTSGLGFTFIGTNVSQPPNGVPVPKSVGGISFRRISPLKPSPSASTLPGKAWLLNVRMADRREIRVQQLERIARASAIPHPASRAGAFLAFDSVHWPTMSKRESKTPPAPPHSFSHRVRVWGERSGKRGLRLQTDTRAVLIHQLDAGCRELQRWSPLHQK